MQNKIRNFLSALSLLVKLPRILFKIGIKNIIFNLIYRAQKKFPYSRLRRLKGRFVFGNFFSDHLYNSVNSEESTIPYFFGWKPHEDTEPPRWNVSCLSGEEYFPLIPWHKIPLYEKDKDIKGVWEASRMDWLVTFSTNTKNGKTQEINRINAWLNDWMQENPPYLGPNWTCAQEASIRIMNLATSALIIDQVISPNKPLIEFIKIHLKRISPAIYYSISQQNNHSTSEAAALFIGGSWLEMLGYDEGRGWSLLGRNMLEEQIEELVDEDGVFSQYSVNYQRLMLDTCSLVEVWRRTLKLEKFKDSHYKKMKSAQIWLEALVDPISGDAPNLGANDGARLFCIDKEYRDFRSSVQLARALFSNEVVYTDEGANILLKLFNLEIPKGISQSSKIKLCESGGFFISKTQETLLVLRFPKFKFRPAQADFLHLDFWVRGKNILNDAGTYSYRIPHEREYFTGSTGHNVIEFDGRNQMKKVSRFLYSDWPDSDQINVSDEDGRTFCKSSYTNSRSCKHTRSAELKDNILKIEDQIEGFDNHAILRWRLYCDNWSLENNQITNGKELIEIQSKDESMKISIVEGHTSKLYLKKDPISIVEVIVNKPTIIYTTLTW
jgi:hypothetical protein